MILILLIGFIELMNLLSNLLIRMMRIAPPLSANDVNYYISCHSKLGSGPVVMFGNPTTTQGVHALKFYSDCRVEVSRSLAKDGDVTYGNLTKVKATNAPRWCSRKDYEQSF